MLIYPLLGAGVGPTFLQQLEMANPLPCKTGGSPGTTGISPGTGTAALPSLFDAAAPEVCLVSSRAP